MVQIHLIRGGFAMQGLRIMSPDLLTPQNNFFPRAILCSHCVFFNVLNDTKLHYKSTAITVFDVGDFKRKKHVQVNQNWSTHHEAKTKLQITCTALTINTTHCYWKYYSQTHTWVPSVRPTYSRTRIKQVLSCPPSCATKLPHANVSTFHTIFSIYYHGNKKIKNYIVVVMRMNK